MVLAMSEGLTMNNHLVFGINQGLAVIPLDGAVGGHHFGRVIVRNITLIFSANGAPLGLVLGQPCYQSALPSFVIFPPAAAGWCLNPWLGNDFCSSVGLHLLFQQLRHLSLDLLLFLP